MKSYLVRLLEKEWSMGNGQCPSCGGLSPKFYSGEIKRKLTPYWDSNPKLIGHEKFCLFARMIKDYGGIPIMLGKWVPVVTSKRINETVVSI